MRKIYTSVDIGSDTIKFLVAEAKDNEINILSRTAVKSRGIRKGLIIDANLAVNTIKDGIVATNKKQ